MNVLFVYPCPPERYQEVEFQRGIASISAVLKRAGHKTILLIVKKIEKKKIDNAISQFVPHLIAITCTSNQMGKIKKIVSIIRESFDLKIVLGGVHPTLMPEESIAIECIFAVLGGLAGITHSHDHLADGIANVRFIIDNQNTDLHLPLFPTHSLNY